MLVHFVYVCKSLMIHINKVLLENMLEFVNQWFNPLNANPTKRSNTLKQFKQTLKQIAGKLFECV